MLSLHTNFAALAAQNAIRGSQDSLATSMLRLATGLRINSAKDDPAGLQIATRLKAQNSGMAVAMRNAQNSMSMLQTADGALDEAGTILIRMKDLATQAADGSSSDDDRDAMQQEYDALADELSNIMSHSQYGGTPLFLRTSKGKFNGAIQFQIGASKQETMELDLSGDLAATHDSLFNASFRYQDDGEVTAPGLGTELRGNPNGAIGNLDAAIKQVGALRSKLGANANRLQHVYNNLSNMTVNTKAAIGRIMDVDYAAESANMFASQMRLQAGIAMLKQGNSMASMILSLLQ